MSGESGTRFRRRSIVGDGAVGGVAAMVVVGVIGKF